MHRKLPWRAEPGHKQDPYRAWLAEIMLQQTTVVTVKEYYLKFLRLWPDVKKLAQAKEEDILREWAGLGYYTRARNLHTCAQKIGTEYNENFPEDLKLLLNLPGIGPYTASAILAMAFGQRIVPVDGNVERVMSRLYAHAQPPSKIKPQIKQQAQEFLDRSPKIFSGDYAQALMDLGATVCTPKIPKCPLCPVSSYCQALKTPDPSRYPVSEPKTKKPDRSGDVFLILDRSGRIYTEKRPNRGLLAGMRGIPTTDWEDKQKTKKSLDVSSLRHIGRVRHSFTHFNLELDVYVSSGRSKIRSGQDGQWIFPDQVLTSGLPRVFVKVVELYQKDIQGKKEK